MSTSLNRRDFCAAALATAATVALPACGGADPVQAQPDMTPPPSTDMAMCPSVANPIAAGPADAAQVNAPVHLTSSNAFLCRDDKGLYAMSDVCPHEGCAVSFRSASGKFVCPCHLSVFDANGGVLQGPAVSPLDHYAVCVDGSGNAIIDPDTMVDPSTRL